MMNDLKMLINQMDLASWILLGVSVGICIFLYLKRNSMFIREMIQNAIKEIEIHFNSPLGQKQIDTGTKIAKAKVPFIIKIFMTKRIAVTILEKSLNFIGAIFGMKNTIDIKGNEESLLDTVETDITLDHNVNTMDLNIQLGDKPIKPDKIKNTGDSTVYAEVNVKTDWKGKPETSATVGFQKKL